jgi:hypothetical protein
VALWWSLAESQDKRESSLSLQDYMERWMGRLHKKEAVRALVRWILLPLQLGKSDDWWPAEPIVWRSRWRLFVASSYSSLTVDLFHQQFLTEAHQLNRDQGLKTRWNQIDFYGFKLNRSGSIEQLFFFLRKIEHVHRRKRGFCLIFYLPASF